MNKGRYYGMISDMLQKENVQILDCVTDWQEVVYISTKNLIDQGYITGSYPKKIIELTEKHGAYYVLCPDVALLHARPEDGVIRRQLSVSPPCYYLSCRRFTEPYRCTAKNCGNHF
jgi:PTS system ascorbate-specific IIA component